MVVHGFESRAGAHVTVVTDVNHIDMSQLNELEWALENAQKKGYKTYFLPEGTDIDTAEQVGFKLPNKHVWHWFHIIGESKFLCFTQSYSQVTGKAKRGVTARWHANKLFCLL